MTAGEKPLFRSQGRQEEGMFSMVPFVHEGLEGLERFSLSAGISQKLFREVEARAWLQKIRKRRPIYLPGEEASSVYLLKAGRVKIVRVTEDGREFVVAILEAGQMFGEIEVLGGGSRDTSAEPLEEGWVRVLPRKDFERILHDHPDLMFELTRWIGLQLKKTQARIEDIAFRDVPTRLARLLLGLSREYGRPDRNGMRLSFRITHQDLVGMIGSTRETVSAVLNDFKRHGWIQLNHRFITIRFPCFPLSTDI